MSRCSKWVRSLILGLALLLETGVLAAPAPVVAVFDLENRAKLRSADVIAMTDYIATRVAEGGRYRIVPRAELQDALRAQKKDSYRACYDESCQIQVGREIAAQKTLSSKVSRIGSTCVVTVQLYDLAQAASERASTAKGGCKVDDVLALLDEALKPFAAATMTTKGTVVPPVSEETTVTTAPSPQTAPQPEAEPIPSVSVPAGWSPTPPADLASRGNEVLAQPWQRSHRARTLLVTEIQGLERLFKATPQNGRDRPMLLIRLATAYGELELRATQDERAEDAKSRRVSDAARKRHIAYLGQFLKEYPRADKADMALYLLAEAQGRAKDLVGARKTAFALIKEYPKSKYVPAVYQLFGRLFYDEGKSDLALRAFEQVLKYPDAGFQVFGHYWRGWSYAKKGELSNAAQSLARARDLARKLPDDTPWKPGLVAELDRVLPAR